MLVKYNEIFKDNIIEIFVGEYYVTKKSEIISTLLGSCISICLMDNENKVFGMNHFLLPYSENNNDITSKSKFGDVLTNLLINEMVRNGAKIENLKAKVFGGGNVMKSTSNVIKVNEENINFIHKYLIDKNITIVSQDIGGTHGRIIYFNTSDVSVYVKKI